MSADVRILLWYDYNVRKNKVSRRTGSVVLPVLSAERKCMKKTDKEIHNVLESRTERALRLPGGI